MGLFDNLSRNVGGLGGGLTAAGDLFSAMAQAAANGPAGESVGQALGRGFSMAGPVLKESFANSRERAREGQFQELAISKALEAPEGSRERMLWASAATGEGGDRMARLLPALWNAQIADRNAGQGKRPTPRDIARDAETIASRQQLIENPGIMGKIDLANPDNLWNRATRMLITQDDPQFNDFFPWAAQSFLRQGGQGPSFEEFVRSRVGAQLGEPVRPDTVDQARTAAQASPSSDTGTTFFDRALGGLRTGAANIASGLGLESANASPTPPQSFESELQSILGVPGGGTGAVPPALAPQQDPPVDSALNFSLMGTTGDGEGSPLFHPKERPGDRRDLGRRERQLRQPGIRRRTVAESPLGRAVASAFDAASGAFSSVDSFFDRHREMGTARVDALGAGRDAQSQLMGSIVDPTLSALKTLDELRRAENERMNRLMRSSSAAPREHPAGR